MNKQEQEWLARVRAALDDSADGLDARTRSRLTQLRHAALDRPHRRRIVWWVPAGVAAALAVGALAFNLLFSAMPALDEPSIEDMDMLSSTSDIDLFDDLDFYEWLVQRQAG